MDQSGMMPDRAQPRLTRLAPCGFVHPVGARKTRGSSSLDRPDKPARFPHRLGRAPALAHTMYRRHPPRSSICRPERSLSRLRIVGKTGRCRAGRPRGAQPSPTSAPSPPRLGPGEAAPACAPRCRPADRAAAPPDRAGCRFAGPSSDIHLAGEPSATRPPDWRFTILAIASTACLASLASTSAPREGRGRRGDDAVSYGSDRFSSKGVAGARQQCP